MTDTLIDATLEQPKYQQLIDGVLMGIEQGTLTLGQQLPSISELAGQQHVAKVTVISTDFAATGQTAGQLLTSQTREKHANPARLILRQSL